MLVICKSYLAGIWYISCMAHVLCAWQRYMCMLAESSLDIWYFQGVDYLDSMKLFGHIDENVAIDWWIGTYFKVINKEHFIWRISSTSSAKALRAHCDWWFYSDQNSFDELKWVANHCLNSECSLWLQQPCVLIFDLYRSSVEVVTKRRVRFWLILTCFRERLDTKEF